MENDKQHLASLPSRTSDYDHVALIEYTGSSGFLQKQTCGADRSSGFPQKQTCGADRINRKLRELLEFWKRDAKQKTTIQWFVENNDTYQRSQD